jgi:hypothetical protein
MLLSPGQLTHSLNDPCPQLPGFDHAVSIQIGLAVNEAFDQRLRERAVFEGVKFLGIFRAFRGGKGDQYRTLLWIDPR